MDYPKTVTEADADAKTLSDLNVKTLSEAE